MTRMGPFFRGLCLLAHCPTGGLWRWGGVLLRTGAQGFSACLRTQCGVLSIVLEMWVVLANGEILLNLITLSKATSSSEINIRHQLI